MADKYHPIFGRVLLERKTLSKVGSIIIPEDQRKRQAVCKGKIVALGETAGWTTTYDDAGNPKIVRSIKVGDTVSFGRHAGTWLDASYGMAANDKDDAPYFLCLDEDLLGVIETGE